MPFITLSKAQLQEFGEAKDSIEVRDEDGVLLGHLTPSPDYLMIKQALMRRGSKGKKIPSHRVQEFLRTLDDAAHQGANEKELRDLSRKLLNEITK